MFHLLSFFEVSCLITKKKSLLQLLLENPNLSSELKGELYKDEILKRVDVSKVSLQCAKIM